ncbi:MAG: HEAT repeat domain-containing protein, partial [Planctomycetota bacterium]
MFRLRRIECRFVDGRCAFLYSLAAALTVIPAGCVQPAASRQTNNDVELRRRAMEGLKAAVGYRHNPVVRVEAVEALAGRTSDEGAPWIRSALLDDHAAVRFAACVAVGEARDVGAEAGVARCLKDPNASIRVAALFARHRLGHTERSG